MNDPERSPEFAWHVIYNLDGTFRGYEWALDENGNVQPSRVYAQEGRDDRGRPHDPQRSSRPPL